MKICRRRYSHHQEGRQHRRQATLPSRSRSRLGGDFGAAQTAIGTRKGCAFEAKHPDDKWRRFRRHFLICMPQRLMTGLYGHLAEHDAARQWLGEEIMREAENDGACLGEAGAMFIRQHNIERTEIIF